MTTTLNITTIAILTCLVFGLSTANNDHCGTDLETLGELANNDDCGTDLETLGELANNNDDCGTDLETLNGSGRFLGAA